MTSENEKLRQYLLGNLAPDEAEQLDLRVISDEALEEDLLQAEHELVEDYLENSLSAAEIELFHGNFLTSAERKTMLREISLLQNYARRRPAAAEPVSEEKDRGFFHSVARLFALPWRPATAGFAVLLVLLLAGAVWIGFRSLSSGGPGSLEQEYARLNQRDLAVPENYRDLSNISLLPGAYRNNSTPFRLSAEKLTGAVFFRLALPFELKPESVLIAELWRDNNLVFRLDNARVYQNDAGRECRLLLPKEVLGRGQYQIRLNDSASGETLASYSFAVE